MITLSLCMIVKDEEDTLARILEPMKTVADEIIIVDTGSTDRTREIAAHFTPLVYDFPWRQDFSAARNFAVSKASGDYWMWLDADDVIRDDQRQELQKLKETLDPAVDVVMMKYTSGPLTYYRERLLKNGRGFAFCGRVHEAVTPAGIILYSPIEIEHQKTRPSDPDRNLQIYESMLENGETLDPRSQYYYGRELYDHGRYGKAAAVFRHFLEDPDGWSENKIDACLLLSRCHHRLGQSDRRRAPLLLSFLFDLPRAEICCELGHCLMDAGDYRRAAYWYEQALFAKPPADSGAFIQTDCQEFIPCLQLCVCYDRLGDHQKAYEFHKRTLALQPDAEPVRLNEEYFRNLGLS